MALAHDPLPANDPCVVCHTAGDLGALHVGADNGVVQSCFVCHSDAGVPEVRDCVVCHPEKVEPHGYEPADHQSNVGANTISGSYPSGVTYGPVRCDVCHLTELFPEHQRPTASAAADSCAACHPAPVDTLVPDWALGCVEGGCHAVATPQEQHAGMAAAHAIPPESAACAAEGCHDQGDLGAVHAKDNPTGGCAYCHSTLSLPSTNQCVDCHGTPHGDLAAAHTADEPGGMTWANTGAYAPCTQCHHLDIRTEHAKTSSGSLGCDACHAPGGPVEDLGGPWTGQCSACHTSIHPEYDAEHLAYGQDCNSCHGEPEDARDFHRGCNAVPGGGWTAGSAELACHPGPDYVPYPRLPDSGAYWCRTCHPNE
jgi:hypothetical protein